MDSTFRFESKQISMTLPEGWTISAVRDKAYEFRGLNDLDLVTIVEGPPVSDKSSVDQIESDLRRFSGMTGDSITAITRVEIGGIEHVSALITVQQPYGASLRRQFFLSFPRRGNFIVTGTLGINTEMNAHDVKQRDALYHVIVKSLRFV